MITYGMKNRHIRYEEEKWKIGSRFIESLNRSSEKTAFSPTAAVHRHGNPKIFRRTDSIHLRPWSLEIPPGERSYQNPSVSTAALFREKHGESVVYTEGANKRTGMGQ